MNYLASASVYHHIILYTLWQQLSNNLASEQLSALVMGNFHMCLFWNTQSLFLLHPTSLQFSRHTSYRSVRHDHWPSHGQNDAAFRAVMVKRPLTPVPTHAHTTGMEEGPRLASDHCAHTGRDGGSSASTKIVFLSILCNQNFGTTYEASLALHNWFCSGLQQKNPGCCIT